MAWGTYLAYAQARDEYCKNQILFTFIFAMILLIAWFVIFFVENNLSLAFYTGLLFVFVAFVQLALNWQSNATAGYFTLWYFIFAIIMVIIVWNIWSSSIAKDV